MRFLAVAVPVLAMPSLAAAQTLGRGAGDSIDVVRVLAALALCLALAVAAALLIRQRQDKSSVWPLKLPFSVGGAAAGRRVAVLERLRVTPQLEVCLLRWDEREVLVGATASGGFVVLGPTETDAQ